MPFGLCIEFIPYDRQVLGQKKKKSERNFKKPTSSRVEVNVAFVVQDMAAFPSLATPMSSND